MPRIPRIIIPGVPHHIIHRGNRRQDVFFTEQDKKRYLWWLTKYSHQYGLDILAYCLMSNHIHLIGIPRTITSIAEVMHIVNTRHTQTVNTEQGWTGHLFQGRYFSTSLDDVHLWVCIKYVEQNPVRAGLVSHAADYPWSSAKCHCGLCKNIVQASETGYDGKLDDWFDVLKGIPKLDLIEIIRHRTQKGIPCGDDDFLEKISNITGQAIKDRPKGRPSKKRGQAHFL